MRVAILSALALIAATALPSPADAAFRCALRPDRCEIVYAELHDAISSQIRDERLFAHLLEYPRRIKVIERHSERMRRRILALDTDVANEVMRLFACDALDQVAALQNRPNNDSTCADQF